MPNLDTIQTNFTAGEVSPKVFGRVDVERYQNGAASLENCVVNIHGGAERRPGSEFEAEAKFSDRRHILVPFVFSRTQAYMLEVGDLYIRIYVAGGGQILAGGAPYEVITPYSVAMLGELDFTQGADTMFLFHPAVTPQVLRRVAEDNWTLQAAPFTALPFEEIGTRPDTILTLESAAVGTGVVFAAVATFLPVDVGRRITFGTGAAVITAWTDDGHVEAEITAAFPQTSIAAGLWTLEDSPQAGLKPSEKGTIDQTITLSFDNSDTPVYGPSLDILGISTDDTSVFVSCAAHGFSNDDTVQMQGNAPAGYNGTFIVAVPGPDTFIPVGMSYPGFATLLGVARKVTNISETIFGWREEDVGKYVRINRGLVRITEWISANAVEGKILQLLDSDVAAPADAWTLESAVWNAVFGYPRTGCFYEQRLIVGGSVRDPQAIWGSRSGLFYDFTLGTADDDAFSFALPSTGQINPIEQLISSAVLIPLTMGGEYTMAGGVEKSLNPTNVQIKPRTVYGCSAVKPVRVGAEILFIQRAGRKVRALSFDPDTYKYAAPDLTVMSEHITKSGIVAAAYAQEPRSLAWLVRADGKMAVLTLDRDEGVVAWTPASTAGNYESVAAVPVAAGDEVWTSVTRMVAGQPRRYVERLVDGQYLDSAVNGTSEEGSTTWAGLDHLDGEIVSVRADGTYLGEFPVVDGQVVIDQPAYVVQIGFNFTNQVKLLRPEVMAAGTLLGKQLSNSKVYLLLLDSIGVTVNGDPIEFRHFDESLLDNPPDALTGLAGIGLAGSYAGDSPLTIVQDQPYPFHLLAVIRKLTANG